MTIARNPIERFWEKVDKTETCWVWIGMRDSQGYGKFQIGTNKKKKLVRAHRFSYEIIHGTTELLVLHKCDNPPCVNPDHLYAGTHSDNMRDAHTRNRIDYSKLPRGNGQWLRKNPDNPNLKLVREGAKRYWDNPDNRAKESERATKYWEDPNNRAQMSETVKNLIKNGVNHHNMKDSKGRFTKKIAD